jgi:hypothetical protein
LLAGGVAASAGTLQKSHSGKQSSQTLDSDKDEWCNARWCFGRAGTNGRVVVPRRVAEEDDWPDKREIHEDSVRCPHCENYLSEEDAAAPSRKPWWIIVGVLVCLYVVYRWIVG